MAQNKIIGNTDSVVLDEIPELSYQEFSDHFTTLLSNNSFHCVNYFYSEVESKQRLIACIANDETHDIHIFSHILPVHSQKLHSLSETIPALHVFERDIAEKSGLIFQNHPWPKALRFPSESKLVAKEINDYPFFSIEGEDLHEVGVGPVHAGIIEPGHFRFICNGEIVFHLELQLGYQHRGIEKLICNGKSRLQQLIIAENICGDTAIGHATAVVSNIDSLANFEVNDRLKLERFVALELERVAIHLGDTAALSADIAYQLGQAGNEALRTMMINAMQVWCGNRFGKGLIRPGGTDYQLTPEISANLRNILEDVRKRYSDLAHRIYSLPSVLDRFESIGQLSLTQVQQIGAVGMVAKSTGLKRDIRWSHPAGHYSKLVFEPVVLETGDVWARGMLRNLEILQSISMILKALSRLEEMEITKPDYSMKLQENRLTISLVEGWRGEICHTAISDSNGKIACYSIVDPSLHNWTALAVAMRNQEISDFPLCNKSFNLSYCGHDL
jgi:Ni,Fe-hydrogenase III large subunit